MYELILLYSWMEDARHDDCADYFEHQHVPLVEELPGLERLTTSMPLAAGRLGTLLGTGEATYDVRMALQFEDLADAEAAFDSRAGQRVLQDAGDFVEYDHSVAFGIVDETLRYRPIPSYV